MGRVKRLKKGISNYFPRRNSLQRPTKKFILIVCEGKETEPNYFYSLKNINQVKEKYNIDISGGQGSNPEQIVNAAISKNERENNKYDETWCVLDSEGPSNKQSLKKAISIAKKEH